jgi:hypothetical protein
MGNDIGHASTEAETFEVAATGLERPQSIPLNFSLSARFAWFGAFSTLTACVAYAFAYFSPEKIGRCSVSDTPLRQAVSMSVLWIAILAWRFFSLPRFTVARGGIESHHWSRTGQIPWIEVTRVSRRKRGEDFAFEVQSGRRLDFESGASRAPEIARLVLAHVESRAMDADTVAALQALAARTPRRRWRTLLYRASERSTA